MIDHNTVISIYDCYKRAMGGVGWKVQMPANTDQTKTYAYRAIKKFIEQSNKWELDDKTMRALIYEVVLYGKRNGLLSKGTALLNMKSILSICYNYLRGVVSQTDLLICEIKRSQDFINKHIDGSDDKLLFKDKRNGYCNITKWFRCGSISLNYVAVSVKCRKALNALTGTDRYEFPDDSTLLRIKIKLLCDVELRRRIEDIVGNDISLNGLMERSK